MPDSRIHQAPRCPNRARAEGDNVSQHCPAVQEYGELCGRAVTRPSGFCGLHDPVEVARRRPQTKVEAEVHFTTAQIVETVERQGDFDVWSVYLEDAAGKRILRWRESLHATSRQGHRESVGRRQNEIVDELSQKYTVDSLLELMIENPRTPRAPEEP